MKPVYFLGKVVANASSKWCAACEVHNYLWARRDTEQVGEEYRPVMPRLRNHPRWAEMTKIPTMGRLVKNTRDLGDRFEVGLGIPDRRRKLDR